MPSHPRPRRSETAATALAILLLLGAVAGQGTAAPGRMRPVAPVPPVPTPRAERTGLEPARVAVLPSRRTAARGRARLTASGRGQARLSFGKAAPSGHAGEDVTAGEPKRPTAEEALGTHVWADFEGAPVEEILRCLELETGRSFLLEREVSRALRCEQPVGSLQCEDLSAACALDRLLRPLGIAVAIRDGEILLVDRGRLQDARSAEDPEAPPARERPEEQELPATERPREPETEPASARLRKAK